MPYCPKCGVEVDIDKKNCPLCDFDIPDIGLDKSAPLKRKFPYAQNITTDKSIELKSKIYYVISIISLATILVLLYFKVFVVPDAIWIKYAYVSVFYGWIFTFFFLGFINSFKINSFASCLTTILITLTFDYFDKSLSWSLTIALPIIVTAFIISIILAFLFKRSKNKNKFIFIPSYIGSGLSLLCIIIDFITNYNFTNTYKLSWSIIVFILLNSITAILLGLYYRLSIRLKEKLKRKLHI